MNSLDRKQAIEASLQGFVDRPLREAGLQFFESLGYKSGRRVPLTPNTAENFLATFGQSRPISPDQALTPDWKSVDILFQLTDAEVQSGGQGRLQFESKGQFDGAIIESYLFLAIELKAPDRRAGERRSRFYTRTELSTITRGVNRLFDMPVMLLFRHGETLTLSIIRRRQHKRDETKDVLEKVTLIRDIQFADPLRAHVEILHDLSLQALYDEYYFHNFVGLQQAWEKRLDSYVLNERFYREVADWYFWALQHPGVVYPRDVRGEEARSIFLIRLLTRLIFCWFLQEKGLIPRDLFRRHYVENALKDFSSDAGTYYRAFLQNLFFATLNQESDKRAFRRKSQTTFPDGHRGITNLYRFADLLSDVKGFMNLLKQVPFVNGGLFDCLDEVYEKKEGPASKRLDDFSEEKNNRLCIPNELFFSDEHEVDLSDVYGDGRRRSEQVRGLIDILSRYKFTVEENTPLEQDIALDPELLGKVFENLLASYNEDTRTSARKATGSFYTPREIVTYLVDDALIAYFDIQVQSTVPKPRSPIEPRLRQLFASDLGHFENPFTTAESYSLIAAINRIKILDPACGSGAFPMGALHRLVDLLQKLDPNNRLWKEQQLAKATAYRDILLRSNAPKTELEEVDARITDIEHSFDTRFHALDFARKLYLIENCIYGVDIQPIACQIAKLRFFIALIVDQNVDNSAPNRGVRALPNLESKIVAANVLIPIERPEQQMDLLDVAVRPLREQLERVRHEYFLARTPAAKAKCRQRDSDLRRKISDLLRDNGLPANTAKALANWDPYDQNAHATFFDPEWMFGLPIGVIRLADKPHATLLGNFSFINDAGGQAELVESTSEIESGFDVVIGNPPYIRLQTLKQQDPKLVEFFKEHYKSAHKGNYDVYVVFVERGLQLLKSTGNLAFILPHKFFNAQYGEPLRALIARGRYLSHVVHFGDQQVFPGQTNYVCLLFLHRSGTDSLRFIKVDSLGDWLKTKQGEEAAIPFQKITAAEWNFAVGEDSEVLERLTRTGKTLADAADRIFQGIIPGADKVYTVDMLERRGNLAVCYSRALDKKIKLEAALLRPIVSGTDVGRFAFKVTERHVLYPYRVDDGQAELIGSKELKSNFTCAFRYFQDTRDFLDARDGGSAKGPEWYRYIRTQNIALQVFPKLAVPRLVVDLHASFDESGSVCLDNVDVGGIIPLDKSRVGFCFLLALLNSRVLNYFFLQTSAHFRGGFHSANRQFIEQLPIPSGTDAQKSSIGVLVDYLLWLNRQPEVTGKRAVNPRDPLMMGYFEQIINGLVYELFFPNDLHAARLFPFQLIGKAGLPKAEDIPISRRLNVLRETFERLYATNHPLRGCLFSIRSIEPIRVIEGENENHKN
jgi:type I restriction-modification system DNA methylase subunit